MRRSIPGQKKVAQSKPAPRRRSIPVKQGALMENKSRPVPYDPDYDMQYHQSRKTGDCMGGFYWNPPADCISPRIICTKEDSWVETYFCHNCTRYKDKSCQARRTTTKIYTESYVADTPQARKAAQKKRRRS